MLGIHDYSLFIGSALLLNITPGPDTIFVLSSSVSGGRRAGVVSVLGISSGLLLHTVAVAMGLSAMLLASASLFTITKLLGAVYLVFLGIKTLFSELPLNSDIKASNSSIWRVYRQGFLTNALNPKVALFFMALLPQFVDARNASPGLGLFVLGLSFIATCTVWCLVLAFFAASFCKILGKKSAITRAINKATGFMFVGLGVKLAFYEKA